MKDDIIMVAESHQYVSSFNKLTLELAVQYPLADHIANRIAAELVKNVNEELF